MKYEYDLEVDVLTIKLASGKPDHGEQMGNVIAHYNLDDQLVELEILDASKTVLKAMKPTQAKTS